MGLPGAGVGVRGNGELFLNEYRVYILKGDEFWRHTLVIVATL